MDTDNLLRVSEAARIKSCSRQSIYNALGRGDLNGTTVSGFRFVVRDGAFGEWQVEEKYIPDAYRTDTNASSNR